MEAITGANTEKKIKNHTFSFKKFSMLTKFLRGARDWYRGSEQIMEFGANSPKWGLKSGGPMAGPCQLHKN